MNDSKITELDVSNCEQKNISGIICNYLSDSKVKKLNIYGWSKKITDKSFKYLKDSYVESLNMSYCNNCNVTDKSFKYLKDSMVTDLNMSFCNQNTITDKSF